MLKNVSNGIYGPQRKYMIYVVTFFCSRIWDGSYSVWSIHCVVLSCRMCFMVCRFGRLSSGYVLQV